MKLACVQYLNALPFTTALREQSKHNAFQIIEAVPSQCAEMLKSEEVDLALLPVGALIDFKQLYLASDYCIGCLGEVRTVKLFSNTPIESIQEIELDPSSRTSNILLQILMQEYWKRNDIVYKDPTFQTSERHHAKLIIGDQAFEMENRYQYEYDLGKAWFELTTLPFVFAIWVSKNAIQPEKKQELNKLFRPYVETIHQLAQNQNHYDQQILQSYFSQNILYELDSNKLQGLNRFLELANIPNCLHE